MDCLMRLWQTSFQFLIETYVRFVGHTVSLEHDAFCESIVYILKRPQVFNQHRQHFGQYCLQAKSRLRRHPSTNF